MSWIDDLTDHQRKDFEWLIQGFNRNMPSSAHISLGCTVPQYAHKRAVQADVLWRDLKLMDEDELSTETEIEDITTQLKLKQESQISKKRRKFGRAPSLVAYRSHNIDLAGQPYQNKSGSHYYGSICDICEEGGYSYFHHPLRCHRQHPGWRKQNGAPERNGITSWYVRGGGIETLNGSVLTSVGARVQNE